MKSHEGRLLIAALPVAGGSRVDQAGHALGASLIARHLCAQ